MQCRASWNFPCFQNRSIQNPEVCPYMENIIYQKKTIQFTTFTRLSAVETRILDTDQGKRPHLDTYLLPEG